MTGPLTTLRWGPYDTRVETERRRGPSGTVPPSGRNLLGTSFPTTPLPVSCDPLSFHDFPTPLPCDRSVFCRTWSFDPRWGNLFRGREMNELFLFNKYVCGGYGSDPGFSRRSLGAEVGTYCDRTLRVADLVEVTPAENGIIGRPQSQILIDQL